MSYFMKKPCLRCPFRRDVKPYLTPERGEELAYAATNRYSSFSCHKTTVYSEEEDDMVCDESTKECAGFITLQVNEGAKVPEGFEPAFDLVYGDSWDMAQAYENPEEWEEPQVEK